MCGIQEALSVTVSLQQEAITSAYGYPDHLDTTVAINIYNPSYISAHLATVRELGEREFWTFIDCLDRGAGA